MLSGIEKEKLELEPFESQKEYIEKIIDAHSFERMGLFYKEKGDWENPLKNLEIALEIFREIDEKESEANDLAHMGLL